jgi:hypothetical protein
MDGGGLVVGLIEQPRPHSVAQKHAERCFMASAQSVGPLSLPGCSLAGMVSVSRALVSTARWMEMMGTPTFFACFWV